MKNCVTNFVPKNIEQTAFYVLDLTCSFLSSPPNARVEYSGTGVNRRAKYICNDGYYRRTGSSSRRCTGGGTWEGLAADCQSISEKKSNQIFIILAALRRSVYVTSGGVYLRGLAPGHHRHEVAAVATLCPFGPTRDLSPRPPAPIEMSKQLS